MTQNTTKSASRTISTDHKDGIRPSLMVPTTKILCVIVHLLHQYPSVVVVIENRDVGTVRMKKIMTMFPYVPVILPDGLYKMMRPT